MDKMQLSLNSIVIAQKMRYSIEPKEKRYVKGDGFLSFAKNIGRSLSNKYAQKFVDTAKKFATDALKTASRRAIQKTAEATGDLLGNKIADKITSCSKNLQIAEQSCNQIKQIMKYQKKDIYLHKEDNKLLMN